MPSGTPQTKSISGSQAQVFFGRRTLISSSCPRLAKSRSCQAKCCSSGQLASDCTYRPARRKAWSRVEARRTAVGTLEQPEPEDFPPESLLNFTTGRARRAIAKSAPVNSIRPYLQLLQLAVVLALLILVPAQLFCHKIPPRVWVLAAVYTAFFGFGSLQRMLAHGNLSPRKQDAQVQTQRGKRSLIGFVVAVVAGGSGAYLKRCKCQELLGNERTFSRHCSNLLCSKL